MKINLGKLIGAIVKTAKEHPDLVISAVTAVAPVVKAVKEKTKKPADTAE